MIHNAGLFLKKAAEEIAAHVDGPNAAFDIDRATQVTVLMQIAVELSATAIVLKHEGFAGVMKSKDLPATDAELRVLWEAGSIRTINFEQIKPKRSEEHTSELQSLMRISYAGFCLKKKKKEKINTLREKTHTKVQKKRIEIIDLQEK